MSKKFLIDEDRKARLGFEEVVFGAAKSLDLLLELMRAYTLKKQNVLVTKLQKEKATVLLKNYKAAFYDEESEIFMLKPVELSSEQAKVSIPIVIVNFFIFISFLNI